MYKKILYVLILLIGLSKGIRSEIVILKSGERIEGKIINQSRTKIELQKEDGTKVIIDKDKIEKIQFGPTQREIEEKKRKEEEQRRKEEERLRKEEERRRIEEEQRRKEEEERLKREEEERRRLEEEQLKKEAEERKKLEIRKKEMEKIKSQIQKTPISTKKREGWEIGYGGGPANVVPSFMKIYDLFFYMFTSGSILVPNTTQTSTGDNNILYHSIQYNNNSYNNQVSLKYLGKNLEWGISLTSYHLHTSNFKDIYRFESRGQLFLPGNNELQKSVYQMYDFWVKGQISNIFYFEFDAIINEVIIKQNINYIRPGDLHIASLKFEDYPFIELLGAGIELNIGSYNEIDISILFPIIGSVTPTLEYTSNKLPSDLSFLKTFLSTQSSNNLNQVYTIKVKFNENMDLTQISGEYYKIRWNYNIYDNYRLYIEYSNSKRRDSVKKFNIYDSTDNIIPEFSLVSDLLLVGQKRIATEKQQYVNLGISYRFQ